ncbi:hypothetical protein D210916BOD24_12950 [Alteromonas sp. D210916BOD_24]|uniref:DUF3307 domain-containing protein n=1 Tax=Alteromonas sp. D210916BOD_24 TaxID=3157618 RepID=UPI00399D2D94
MLSGNAIPHIITTIEQPVLLMGLLLAHTLGDFYLQPYAWVKSRNERHALALHLYLHALVHGVLIAITLLVLGQNLSVTTILITAVIVAVSHFKIDVIKSYCKQNTSAFVIDQLLHLLILLSVFLYLTGQWNYLARISASFTTQHLAVLLAYLVILRPSAFLIKQLLSPWSADVGGGDEKTAHPNDTPSINLETQQTLALAGQRIGYLERVLMLTFVLLNQFAAIGFLIAAKSIFRFGDLTKHQDRKLTEYVLLGTFTSVVITLIVGLVCAAILGHLPVKQ